MRNWVFLPIVLICGILQVTLLDYLKIFNLKPDLLLVCALVASLVTQLRWALFLSLFAGIFKDAFGTTIFGLNSLLFVCWSFLIIRLTKEISIDNNFMRVILIFIISILHNTITGLMFIYLGSHIGLNIFLRNVLFGSMYTAAVLPLVSRISKRFIFGTRPTYQR